MAPHLLRRVDAVAKALDIDRTEVLHTAVARWLEEEERNVACRDRMLKVRAMKSGASRIA